MVLFQNALFLASNFPKLNKFQFFYWNFFKILKGYSKLLNSFVQPNEKLTHVLLTFLKNIYAKIMHFRNFLKKYSSQILRRPTPQGRPPKCFPAEPKSWVRPWGYELLFRVTLVFLAWSCFAFLSLTLYIRYLCFLVSNSLLFRVKLFYSCTFIIRARSNKIKLSRKF